MHTTGRCRAEVNGPLAWEHCVPLSRRLAVKPSMTRWQTPLDVRGYLYPHGVGLVIEASLKAPLPIDQLRKWAYALRGEPLLVDREGRPGSQESLDDVADTALITLRQQLVGRASRQTTGVQQPFSVLTIVSADGYDGNLTNNLQKNLYGMATWSDQWHKVKLQSLKQVTVPFSADIPEDLLFVTNRGRVLWVPSYFDSSRRPTSVLSRRHRETVLLSLQIESLAGLVQSICSSRGELSPTLYSCRRHAAKFLGRIYGSAKSTYASPSSRRHIEDNDYLGPIDKIRKAEGEPPLHP
jgi:hypothetical protein